MKILFRVIFFLFLIAAGLYYNWFNKNLNHRDTSIIENTTTSIVEKPLGWPWHGTTISTHYDLDIDSDLKKLKIKGVNFVSIYLKPRKIAEFENLTPEVAFLMSLQKADEILNKCKELNIYALIYFSEFPIDPTKGRVRINKYFWEHNEEQKIALNYISKTIDHFKSRGKELQAYQFIGEPVTVRRGKVAVPDGWKEYFKKIHTLIRSKDKNRFIVYGPGPGGRPEGYKDLKPILDDPKIIYSFHYYLPQSYSHQGIKRFKESFSYPGKIAGKNWNKKAISNSLSPVFSFQKKYKKLIYVGEFSAIYSAEGWENYLIDQIEIYQDNAFSYTYFTFNGYKGWAISDKNQSSIKKKNFGKFNLAEREKRLELLSKFWKNEN